MPVLNGLKDSFPIFDGPKNEKQISMRKFRILLGDGQCQDKGDIKPEGSRQNNWGMRAVRIAIALGCGNADNPGTLIKKNTMLVYCGFS